MKPQEATGVMVTIATSIDPTDVLQSFKLCFDHVTSETSEQKV